MRPGTASRLAWGLGALALVLMCGGVTLTLLNVADFSDLNTPIIEVASVVVGGLVASRRPGNPVGWLFLGGALFQALRELTAQYAVYGIQTDPGSLPWARTSAGFSNSVEIVGPVLLFVLVPLYFPTGRPVSRRWGLVAWLALGALPPMTFLGIVSPGEAVYATGIQNPWSVAALRPVVDTVGPLGFVYYIGLIFAAAASLLVRLRRSRGEERQQIKWLAFAASFIPVWFLTNAPIERAVPTLFSIMDALVIAGVPVAAGIAILRYRLYDIDLIINRALVYGLLTVTLAALYLGGVTATQATFSALSGQQELPQLVVVGSTLVIATLFNPLRRRIQSFIDRRFYRRKYDAVRTLETFSARLRNETDLDTLGGDLVAVVRETVQPEHTSLWLRGERGSGRRGAP